MSANETTPTTKKQKVLIGLISAVIVLLIGQLLIVGGNDSEPAIDRETCLAAGNIWSQSAEKCYGNGL